MSALPTTKDTGSLASPDEIPFNEPTAKGSINPATASFSCHWTGCSAKPFTRRSDLRKHWERHTKPYVCQEAGCNAVTFGDKASLHRHEAEKHARHDAKRYFCTVESCPRATKGFPRKRNRDAHITTRHTSTMPTIGNGDREENTSESPEKAIVETQWARSDSEGRKDGAAGDMKDLELKLRELEEEKNSIDLRRSRVEVDIAALQRVMQLIATKSASKDVDLDLENA